MNEANTKYLFDNFKFFHPEKPLTESLMSFGFDCGDGWFELVRDLCWDLEDQLEIFNMPDFEVIQVKEKSGELCVGVIGVPEEYKRAITDLIKQAGNKSLVTCECCGKPGKISRHYRIPRIAYVLCDNCVSRDRY